MIDISDGLLSDLNKILTMSMVGATLNVSQLPLSDDFKQFQGQLTHNKIDYALSGGEDYELLFTSPQNKEEELMQLSHNSEMPITKIGEINATKSLVVLDHEPAHGSPLAGICIFPG